MSIWLQNQVLEINLSNRQNVARRSFTRQNFIGRNFCINKLNWERSLVFTIQELETFDDQGINLNMIFTFVHKDHLKNLGSSSVLVHVVWITPFLFTFNLAKKLYKTTFNTSQIKCTAKSPNTFAKGVDSYTYHKLKGQALAKVVWRYFEL